MKQREMAELLPMTDYNLRPQTLQTQKKTPVSQATWKSLYSTLRLIIHIIRNIFGVFEDDHNQNTRYKLHPVLHSNTE